MFKHAVTAILAGALLSSAAWAGEKKKTDVPRDVSAKTLRAALSRFEAAFDTVDIDFKLKAVRTLSKTQHKSVGTELLKLLKSKDKHVRRVAAGGLGRQPTSSSKAGPKLIKLIKNGDEDAKVVAAAVTALGQLDYRKADKALQHLIMKREDPVVIAVFRTYGTWKSDKALDAMAKFFDKWPDEKGFRTISVTVDTGTAGGGDQAAAAAKGKGMLAAEKNWKPRPECTEALRTALKEITGHGFRRPDDLRNYIENPKKYRDPEDVTKWMPEADRRAVYKQWQEYKKKAEQQSQIDMPGDDASEERAKVYHKHLWKLRDDLLEARKLTLSELDVIVEVAETAGW